MKGRGLHCFQQIPESEVTVICIAWKELNQHHNVGQFTMHSEIRGEISNFIFGGRRGVVRSTFSAPLASLSFDSLHMWPYCIQVTICVRRELCVDVLVNRMPGHNTPEPVALSSI